MSEGRSSIECGKCRWSEGLEENGENSEQVLRTLGEDAEQRTKGFPSAVKGPLQLETFSTE